MKLLELHLRNIASIEKADIKFDTDLKDNITGEPASIFLISGDTGTGKSVILDGISMALYKKTPRIMGVANKKENNYTDNKGESISINSIEQYTRLGISEKDECYSELVFEGNDGKTYHARLKLGITKSNRKDENGNYPLKHSTPVWEVKTEDSDWQKVEAKTGQPILNAVGLTFEQFGRMAMLAQGQFASFLTGEKAERESILEQLTNTEKFSQYGDAISNIFNTAKNNKAQAQTTYDTEKGHTLPSDQLQSLKDDLDKCKKEKQQREEEYQKEKTTLDVVLDIRDNLKSCQDAKDQKEGLEEIVRGEAYTTKKSLVVDWDSTNYERQLFADKKKAEQEKNDAEKQLAAAQQTYFSLSADLQFREDAVNSSKQEVEQIQTWIDERKSLDNVYTQVEAIVLKLDQYEDTCDKLKKTESSLSTKKEETDSLRVAVTEWSEKVKKATDAVNTKQASIDALTKERQELHPNELNEQVKDQTAKSNDLGLLKVRVTEADEKHISLSKKKEEIEADTNKLIHLKDVCNIAQKAYTEAENKERDARSLLTTMQMSVEDTLAELRQRLKKSHVDACPLCGQHIDPLHLKDDFQDILSPLQQREEKAKEELESAKTQFNNAKRDYDNLNGSLETKNTSYEKDQAAAEAEDKAIATEAIRLSLDASRPLHDQITENLDKVARVIKELEGKQEQAEHLQDNINQLIKEKTPLDKALEEAKTEHLKAENAQKQNARDIKQLEEELSECEEIKKTLTKNLSSLFGNAYPDWATDTQNVKKQLKTDASEYNAKKQDAENGRKEIDKDEVLLSAIKATQADIISKHSDWGQPIEPRKYDAKNINSEWTVLLSDINHQEEELKSAIATIETSVKALNAYYAESGKNEESLAAIIQSEPKIAEARKYVADIDANLKSRTDAIKDYSKKINDLLEKLSLDSIDDLPAVEPLKDKVEELNSQIQNIVGNIGAIENKIKTNEDDVIKLQEAERALTDATAVFEKWYRINSIFGGTRFRTLVQTYILRPLLNNANIYLEKITDRYTLTCSEDNDQLAILVLDRYNKKQVRSVTVLSGGERFMISLALSLALSSLNRQDMNVNILFIDEGFGTLDETSLNSVMETLEKLQEIAGQSNRRVGIISHREELAERIPVKIRVKKKGEGRSHIEITN